MVYKIQRSSNRAAGQALCLSSLHHFGLSFFPVAKQPTIVHSLPAAPLISTSNPPHQKMTVSRNILSTLAAAAAVGKVHAANGPAFSTGPTSSDTYIVESWATLNLPDTPSDNSGDLSLWVGMGTSNGDLIQSIAENYDSSSWSVYAYTLIETSSAFLSHG